MGARARRTTMTSTVRDSASPVVREKDSVRDLEKDSARVKARAGVATLMRPLSPPLPSKLVSSKEGIFVTGYIGVRIYNIFRCSSCRCGGGNLCGKSILLHYKKKLVVAKEVLDYFLSQFAEKIT